MPRKNHPERDRRRREQKPKDFRLWEAFELMMTFDVPADLDARKKDEPGKQSPGSSPKR